VDSYNSVRHHDGPGTSRLEECERFFCNASIRADIGPFRQPTPKICDVEILGRHDADRELRGCGVIWAVERDSCDWIAAKSSPSSFAQPLACTLEHVLVVARPQP